MTRPATSAAVARLDKILALLDSDHAGEAAAADRALRRILRAGADDAAVGAAETGELEACLGFAVEAVGHLTREIDALRRDNTRLRAQAALRQRQPRHPRPAPWASVG